MDDTQEQFPEEQLSEDVQTLLKDYTVSPENRRVLFLFDTRDGLIE